MRTGYRRILSELWIQYKTLEFLGKRYMVITRYYMRLRSEGYNCLGKAQIRMISLGFDRNRLLKKPQVGDSSRYFRLLPSYFFEELVGRYHHVIHTLQTGKSTADSGHPSAQFDRINT